MDKTVLLSLPYIMPSQAQKHVTHNEAIRKIDILMHLAVHSRSQSAPSETVDEGARFLIPAEAQGIFAGEENKIAAFVDSAWYFFEPQEGWHCFILDEELSVIFMNGAWREERVIPDLNPVDMVGINTSADAYNRFAVAAASVLLTHEGGGHQLKINKQATSDTASLLFQTNWSGHAEMGLNGSNDFSIKASADGSGWSEFLRLNTADKSVALGDFVSRSATRLSGPCAFAVYDKISTPSAAQAGEGAMIYIRGMGAGGPYVYSDGSVWRSLKDDTALV